MEDGHVFRGNEMAGEGWQCLILWNIITKLGFEHHPGAQYTSVRGKGRGRIKVRQEMSTMVEEPPTSKAHIIAATGPTSQASPLIGGAIQCYYSF